MSRLLLLEEVLNNRHAYDRDISIAHHDGTLYQVRAYDMIMGWDPEGMLISGRDINNLLGQKGYRLKLSQPSGILFTGVWMYRIARPEWKLFSLWLAAWYDTKKEGCAQEKQRIYEEIMPTLLNNDKSLTETLLWSGNMVASTFLRKEQEKNVVYDELQRILIAFTEKGTT